MLGVMIGIELSIEGAPIVKACLERRLLINCTHGTVIRLLPAMNLTDEQAHEGCDILADVLKKQAGVKTALQTSMYETASIESAHRDCESRHLLPDTAR